jgi:hypothetical protein
MAMLIGLLRYRIENRRRREAAEKARQEQASDQGTHRTEPERANEAPRPSSEGSSARRP